MNADIRILRTLRVQPDLDKTLRLLGMGGAKGNASDRVRDTFEDLLPEVRRAIVPKAACVFTDALTAGEAGSAVDSESVRAGEAGSAGTESERSGEAASAGKVPGRLVVLATIGPGITRLIEKSFREGDSYNALVIDAMAGSAMFAFENALSQPLMQICRGKGVGISGTVPAGPDMIRRACRAVDSERTVGVRVTDAGLMLPEKTICTIYSLTDDVSIFRAGHDCSHCPSTTCMMRQSRRVIVPAGHKVLDFLRERKIAIASPCNGAGVCGGCEVRLIEGTLPVTPEDSRLITAKDIKDGWRLACRAVPQQDIVVEVPDAPAAEEHIVSVGTEKGSDNKLISPASAPDSGVSHKDKQQHGNPLSAEAAQPDTNNRGTTTAERIFSKTSEDSRFGIAVDIGTTTLAASLVGLSSGRVLKTETAVNHQRAFGSDVVSRVQAAMNGHADELRDMIRADLRKLAERLIRSVPAAGAAEDTAAPHAEINDRPDHSAVISRIVIAANTTMLHLLMGWDTSGLTAYPFRPVSLGGKTYPAGEVLGAGLPAAFDGCTVTLVPGISTYVGGDITAGLLASDFDKKSAPAFFLDLGTNGEMAVGNKDHLTVASAAAGPALEGGNISRGVSSVPGAICDVSIHTQAADTGTESIHKASPGSGTSETSLASAGDVSARTFSPEPDVFVNIRTIAGAAPIGVCGTGVIAAVAELLKSGIIDRTGKLREPYFKEGFPLTEDGAVRFTQQDIREVQLVKGAIRAGIACLLEAFETDKAGDRKKLSQGINNFEDPIPAGRLVLAGGFGYYLNPEKAAAIGLIPVEYARDHRTESAGNTALAGAVRCLTDPDAPERLRHIIDISEEDVLGNDPHFQELYIKYMNF